MRAWLKSIRPSIWFKLLWGILLWLAITFVFLVPRYEDIRAGEQQPIDILIVLLWVALPLMVLFTEVQLFGIRLVRRSEEVLEADRKVPAPPEQAIPYGQASQPLSHAGHPPRTFMPLQARVHFTHEAGFSDLMKVKVNGQLLSARHLVNKDINAQMADGRVFQWFNPPYVFLVCSIQS